MTATRHTLHVPENLNDGRPVPRTFWAWLEDTLFDSVGGFTLTTGTGAWRNEHTHEDGTVTFTTYREPVRLYMVDAESGDLSVLAARVRAELDQEAVYYTRTPLDVELVTV